MQEKPNGDDQTASALLAADLDMNIDSVRQSLGHSTDLILREFWIGAQSDQRAALLYLDGLADTTMVQDFIVRALTSDFLKSGRPIESADDLFVSIKKYALSIAQIKEISSSSDLLASILSGDTIILLEHCSRGLAAGTAGGEDRGVMPPEDHAVVRGPRDAFTENLRTNTSLIRRRIKNPNLWLETKTVGTVSQTKVAILHLKGIADEKVLAEVRKRIDEIQIKGILESGTIEQLIEDRSLSPFPTIYNTERPDILAAGLMEGRVAILVDGTPFVLLVPSLFIQYLQAPEDYYHRTDFGLMRVLRAVAFIIALLGPSLYIAITTFHQELLPTALLISIASGREGVPFPAFVEALIMETTFEILREAGIRMPKAVGQAVSIVGALVIGQAAVEAGLISPSMVIVVAITAISSFALPAYSMGITVRLLRFPLMGLGATVGLYGLFVGFGMLLIHLCSLKSFGVPYMAPFAPFEKKAHKDSLIRFPKLGLFLHGDTVNKKQKKR